MQPIVIKTRHFTSKRMFAFHLDRLVRLGYKGLIGTPRCKEEFAYIMETLHELKYLGVNSDGVVTLSNHVQTFNKKGLTEENQVLEYSSLEGFMYASLNIAQKQGLTEMQNIRISLNEHTSCLVINYANTHNVSMTQALKELMWAAIGGEINVDVDMQRPTAKPVKVNVKGDLAVKVSDLAKELNIRPTDVVNKYLTKFL